VVGLAIKPKKTALFLKKGIYTIIAGSTFIRRGSNTTPTKDNIVKSYQNVETVIGIENGSRNNIEYTLMAFLTS
jgi:hypothetical protein